MLRDEIVNAIECSSTFEANGISTKYIGKLFTCMMKFNDRKIPNDVILF